MAATTIERRTNTLLSKINYTYNKPVSSSDLNESQAIALENVIKYLVGDIPASTLDISVASFSGSTTGLTIKSFKYLCRDDSNHYFYGSVTQDIFLGLNGAVSGNNYELYTYFRSLELDKDSTTYLNGIRSNEYQSGLTETTTPNNIFDDLLNEQVSTRVGLELTFFFRNSEVAGPPTISGWSAPVLVANVTLDTGTGKAEVENETPDTEQQITNIETNITNLTESMNQQFTTINQTVTTLEGSVGTLGTELSQANIKITNIEGQVTQISSEMATITQNVESLQTDVGTNTYNITQLQGSVGLLATELSQTKTDLQTAQSDITSLKSRTTSLESDNTTNKSNITALQTGLSTHEKNFKLHNAVATTAGTSTALTATVANFTLVDGNTIKIKLHTAIGAGATLNVNSLGAKTILVAKGTPVKAGAAAGSYLTLVYNGSSFILQGEGGDSSRSVISVQGYGNGLGQISTQELMMFGRFSPAYNRYF